MRRIILPIPRKYIRALRSAARPALLMAIWNALFVVSGLLLIALGGEAYFRLTKPFINNSFPFHFAEGVGLTREPNSELRYTNLDEGLYIASRVNGQGFLDREPVSPERAAAGCHIAFIGDSYVEAMEVPISDKFHARLEDMAARELPHLAITTQAYGLGGTGQISQLPYYDEYARRLNPKLVVLVFYLNDFFNNSTALTALARGIDPDRMPHMSAQRDARGNLELRPPDPEYERFLLPRLPKRWYESAWGRLVRVSYFAKWLDIKKLIWVDVRLPPVAEWAEIIAERPCCVLLPDVDDWQPRSKYRLSFIGSPFMEERLSPALEEALEYTAFGVEQFKRRADRDGAVLAIVAATDKMGTRGDPQFDRLSAVAESRGIPVISQYDYILRQGHDYLDGRRRGDIHWNATGHQWTAEAVLEWLKENQDVCD